MFAVDEDTHAASPQAALMSEYEQRAANDRPSNLDDQSKPGCPIMMQTSPGIKLLLQVPKVSVQVALPSLIRFFLAHFSDLPLLKAYLESLFGGVFYEEQLEMIRMIAEKMAKYLLLSGLDVEVNLNGKVVMLNGEIMVRMETPKDPSEDLLGSSSTTCAIDLRAQLSLKELLEDSQEIETYIKNSSGSNNASGSAATGTGAGEAEALS